MRRAKPIDFCIPRGIERHAEAFSVASLRDLDGVKLHSGQMLAVGDTIVETVYDYDNDSTETRPLVIGGFELLGNRPVAWLTSLDEIKNIADNGIVTVDNNTCIDVKTVNSGRKTRPTDGFEAFYTTPNFAAPEKLESVGNKKKKKIIDLSSASQEGEQLDLIEDKKQESAEEAA